MRKIAPIIKSDKSIKLKELLALEEDFQRAFMGPSSVDFHTFSFTNTQKQIFMKCTVMNAILL